MPGLLDDVERCALKRALDLGMDAVAAQQLASDIATDLRQEWGGDEVYVPKGARELIQKRNARIRGEYAGGMTARELAELHGLDRQTIYDIVKERRRKTR